MKGRQVPYGRPDSRGLQMMGPECPECSALFPSAYPDPGDPTFEFWECAECGCVWDTEPREEL